MRILATFCASFAAAAAAAVYLLPPASLLPAALLFAAAVFLGFWARGWRRLRIFLLAAGLSFGFLYTALYQNFVVEPCEALVGTEGLFTLELCEAPQETAYGARCEVKLLGMGLVKGRGMYYGEKELLHHKAGERLTVEAGAHSASVSDEGDEFTTFSSRGIHVLLYNEGEERYESGNEKAPVYFPQRSAAYLADLIDENFSPRSAAFFRALLLGDRTQLGVADKTNLSEAGLYHITAVSGLHCGFLLAAAVFLIGRKYARLLCAVTITLLVFYTFLTGASPSTVRASIMLSMVVIAPICRRDPDGPTSLAFSLFLILLANPYAIASVSLQLSYAAVGGIMWLPPLAMKGIGKFPKPVRAVLASFAVTFGACIFTTPLCAYYFGRFSLVMFLSNLLCLGVVSAAFVAGFLALLLAPIPFLGAAAAVAASLGAEYTLAVAKLLSSLPYHAIYFNHPLNTLWLCFAYALAALCVIFRCRRRYCAVLGLMAAVTLVFTAALVERSFHDGALHVTALDVGQGQSILVMQDGYAALIDCGSSASYIDSGEIAADHLLTAGHRRLDALVLTHTDADHANGLESLAARMEIGSVYLAAGQPPYDGAGEGGTPLPTIVHMTTETGEGDILLSLYPSRTASKDDNDRGLAALLTCGEFELLVTGDMSAAAEEKLIEDYALGDIDVLVVGHHGSGRATSREALAALSPETAIISVGHNSYGHPAEETLYRLSDENVRVHRTDLEGTVHIRVN